jgi:hypothetical protein
MDGSVAAAVITSGVALVVAVGNGLRTDLRRSADRRYERGQTFLTDAQDAVLGLRNALREYGAALRARTGGEGGGTGGAFTMSVPEPLDTEVSVAEGRFVVARSRLEHDEVAQAMTRWRSVARVSLIDQRESPASVEQRAFDDVNDLIGAALRSGRATGSRRRSGRDV